MKVKRTIHWKKYTASARQATAHRLCGGLLWCLMLFIGALSIYAYLFSTNRTRILPTTSTDSLQNTADEALSANMVGQNLLTRCVTNIVTATGGYRIGDIFLTEERLLECPAQLDEEQLAETAAQLNLLYQTFQVPTCVIAVPSAGEFYANELLNGLSFPSQMTQINAFYEQMDSAIRKIDVYHGLLTMTDSYIYNRTDPRWTCYGAYCIYRTAIQKMGFSPVSYDQYTITHTTTYRGSLYDSCLYDTVTADVLDVYTCNSGSTVTKMTATLADGTEETRQMYETTDAEDPYAYYLGEDCEKIVIQTDLDNQKKLLLLKDSYANCMVPFLLQHYSEICILDVTCMEHKLETLVDISEYNQILVLCDADTFADANAFDFF